MCCGHAWLCGPHAGIFTCTLILLVGNAILFSVYVALKIHWSLIIVLVVLLAASVLALFRTTCTDPGIIPRGCDPQPGSNGIVGVATAESRFGEAPAYGQPYPVDWKCTHAEALLCVFATN